MWIPGPGERVRITALDSKHYGKEAEACGWVVEYNGTFLIRVAIPGAFLYFPTSDLTPIS